MSYNGSGTFNVNTAGQPVVSGTTITSTAFNLLTADLATGLSTAICKDGQTTTTASIPHALGLSSAGAVVITSVGPHSIGGSTSTQAQVNQTGSITTSGGTGHAWLMQTSLTPGNGNSGVGLRVNPTLIEDAAGTHSVLAGIFVDPIITNAAATVTNAAGILINSLTAGAGTTNASMLKITAAPTGATNNYGIWDAGGNFRFDSAGPHGIGGAPNTQFQLNMTGSYTASGGTACVIYMGTTLTPGNATNGIGLRVNPTLVEDSAGTHSILAGMFVDPIITNAGASVTDAAGIIVNSLTAGAGTTNASMIKISAAPTGATNNYGLWGTGKFRWDDGIAVGATTTCTLGKTGGSGPATSTQNQWLRCNISGTDYFIPVWA